MPVLCFISPRFFTGGPFAIHQAVDRATKLGACAGVMYVKKRKGIYLRQTGQQVEPILRIWQRYKVDARLKAFELKKLQKVGRDACFIVPEVMPEAAIQLLDMGCRNVYIWWLSVDNFPLSRLQELDVLALFRQCTHLCQSAYAREFVQVHGATNTLMLSDVTDVGEVTNTPDVSSRKYDIAYLPAKAKGAGSALKELEKRFSLVALKNMSRIEIKQTLEQSRIFLDFGHHPGKDRVPREAALCGAIPVVRKQGAATFQEDVPLPPDLLLETALFFDEPALVARLEVILRDVEKWKARLAEYRRRIKKETGIFDSEIRRLIDLTQNTRAIPEIPEVACRLT